jgi:glycosyltransferase involved in cell wall biosynthesis
MVSIIIRTKNEERWINSCLTGVFSQEYRDFEVIIVDNESTDKTIDKAMQYDIKKVIQCRDYKPGLALNMGIRASSGEYIVCLSGHCIPVGPKWLSHLIRNFDDGQVAGVYGRQEPLAFTPNLDKRDLSIIFGLDRRVQTKDSFFHNANSMIRRDLWDKVNFDETVTNIEDRVWAEKMLQKGYKIIYEPEAGAYHYHGIHHTGNAQRCNNIVRILESLSPKIKDNIHVDFEKLNVVAIIPVKGEISYLNGSPLIEYTLEQARHSKHIRHIIVSTDNRETAELAESLGAESPFLRDESLSMDFVDTEKVMQYSLNKLEEKGMYPDLVVYLEITFPFRPEGLIDAMIEDLVINGFDSVIAGKKEFKSIWKFENEKAERIDKGYIPRKYKEPCFIGLMGVGCVTHPEVLREGSLLGTKIGIYGNDNPLSSIEVRSPEDYEIAGTLMSMYPKGVLPGVKS